MGWKRYYWLDVQRLVKNLLKPGQTLELTKYFTASIWGMDKDKQARQRTYLEALETLSDLNIYYGHYAEKPIFCFNCKTTWKTHEEKMTDVNIGTEMLMDAFNDRFDTALLISGDSDLVPPTKAINKEFPAKRIVIAFPPARTSMRLRQSASAYFHITEAKLRKSMFTDNITKPDGYVLKRPQRWMKHVKP